MTMRISSSVLTAAGRSTSINWEFIKKKEGDVYEPYVQVNRTDKNKLRDHEKYDRAHYKTIGNSGVTVASGIDLGQQNLRDLLLKVPDKNTRQALEEKLGMFFGVSKKRKEGAIKALDAAENQAVLRFQTTQPELMSILGASFGDRLDQRAEIGKVLSIKTRRLTSYCDWACLDTRSSVSKPPRSKRWRSPSRRSTRRSLRRHSTDKPNPTVPYSDCFRPTPKPP